MFKQHLKGKKGVELTINLIVVIALALIVLIVSLVVFSGKFSLFSTELSKCENIGGKCDTEANCESVSGRFIADKGCSTGKGCCVNQCAMAGGSFVPESQCVPPKSKSSFIPAPTGQVCCT